MPMAFWVLGSMAIFVGYIWCCLRYFVAARKSLGRDPMPHFYEYFDTYFAELLPLMYRRQADSEVERLRWRMWTMFALFIAYVLLSRVIWAVVLG